LVRSPTVTNRLSGTDVQGFEDRSTGKRFSIDRQLSRRQAGDDCAMCWICSGVVPQAAADDINQSAGRLIAHEPGRFARRLVVFA
jgi:hypothetical protein